MKYFYTLWIPTVEVGDPKIIEHNLSEIVLRDDDAYVGVILSGSINNNFRIDIKYSLTNDSTERHLYLDKEWNNQNGFIVYSLTLHGDGTRDDFFIGGMRDEMSTSLYHYIKGFFHKHVNHASDADSKLKAYSVQAEQFRFDDHKSMILAQILGSYDDLFSGQARIDRNELGDALGALSEGKNKFRNLDILDRLAVATNNVLSEVSYCEFLLTYNDADAQNPALCERIRQSIKTLEYDQQQLLFWNNHFHARFSYSDGIAGVRWGVAGVVISCISLLLSIILPMCSHSEERIIKELNKNSIEIKALTDSLKSR